MLRCDNDELPVGFLKDFGDYGEVIMGTSMISFVKRENGDFP